MRVLIDPNLFVSYLLTPSSDSSVNTIVKDALSGRFTLLLPQAIIEELAQTTIGKKYLAQQIPLKRINDTVSTLLQVAEVIPEITEEMPAVTTDPKDDYLIAYALVGEADYLVTGDISHLLPIKKISEVQIVNPKQFIEVISNQEGKSVTTSTAGALKSSEPPLAAKQLREAAEKAIADENS
jgi:uncharacterized protein